MSDNPKADRGAQTTRAVLDLLDDMAAELTFPSAKVSGVIVDGVPRTIELQPEVARAVTKAALRFLRKTIDDTGR